MNDVAKHILELAGVDVSALRLVGKHTLVEGGSTPVKYTSCWQDDANSVVIFDCENNNLKIAVNQRVIYRSGIFA